MSRLKAEFDCYTTVTTATLAVGIPMSLPDRGRWNQLSPRLDELLGLSLGERDFRLSELRERGDPLAPELEALLGAASRADAAHFMTGDMSKHEAIAASLVGMQIGPYTIDALLGEGATGTVWRAHPSGGRAAGDVAIKLLHLSLLGRAGALRFHREGLVLARVAHPGIAGLLDAGVTLGGQPYLVLELVDGTRIDSFCDTRRLDVRQRVLLFTGMLAIVAHAHSHLVIHRDIKPNNIHVTDDGQVKLLDFGIAKLLADETGEPPITAAGLRVLTPQYAAPEQLNGGAVTAATDVYALGILLYVLLAGRHPVALDGASSMEVIRAMLEREPTRLGAALDTRGNAGPAGPARIAEARSTPLPRLRGQLRGDLEKIVARALRKNPLERYQTVTALADDLRRYLAQVPVAAGTDSALARLIAFARRFN
jgi:serine/threonine-protein kinase